MQLLDIDRFKLINDSLGHDQGDELLVAIADCAARCGRTGEIVARFGADAFAIVTPRLTSPTRCRISPIAFGPAWRMGFGAGGERFAPTVSIGMVVATAGRHRGHRPAGRRHRDVPGEGTRPRSGRVVRPVSCADDVVATFEVERELRSAIADGQLRLAFQPVLDLETNTISSCEALVRWQHPDRGLLASRRVHPGRREVRSHRRRSDSGSCARRWRRSPAWPDGVHVAVNISPRQLAEPDLFAIGARHPRRVRRPAVAPRPRGHRERGHRRSDGGRPDDLGDPRARSPRRHRRLRHRIHVAVVPARLPRRRLEDRPELHRRPRRVRA